MLRGCDEEERQDRAGSQRWRRRDCGASRTVRYDDEAARLREFVGWLLSKESQRDMPGQGRAFRRRTASFWSIWPMPEVVDEAHRVAFVDGIWVARDAVVLIACTESHVLSWHLARAETSAAWRSLLSRVAPPDMAVSDGGGGFAKAVAAEWPRTRVQRCLLLASIYFSPFSPTHFRQSRQRGYAEFANADAPLSASRRRPPSRPHRRWTRPSGGTTGPLS